MAGQLVAHRGLPYRYPENTLPGFQAAVSAGARWLETDVQLTADRVPILYHDADTRRLSGRSGELATTGLAELQRYGAFHPERFDRHFRGLPVNTLDQLLEYRSSVSHVQVFLELKVESAQRFGMLAFLDTVLEVIDRYREIRPPILISFGHELLREIRHRGTWPIGLVTADASPGCRALAGELQPEYVFMDRRLSQDPEVQSWRGPWQRALYTVNELAEIQALASAGWDFLETDRFDEFAMVSPP